MQQRHVVAAGTIHTSQISQLLLRVPFGARARLVGIQETSTGPGHGNCPLNRVVNARQQPCARRRTAECLGVVMKRVMEFFRNHAVLTYFVFVFLISWGGGLLIVGPGALPLPWRQFESLGALLYILMLASPCLPGILLTGVVKGREGLGDLVTRLRRRGVGWIWYALALMPALMAAAMSLLAARVPRFPPRDHRLQ
jgi:hypothetical protein